eukprot:6184722-Pleurochrysis_carterae.AAC.1
MPDTGSQALAHARSATLRAAVRNRRPETRFMHTSVACACFWSFRSNGRCALTYIVYHTSVTSVLASAVQRLAPVKPVPLGSVLLLLPRDCSPNLIRPDEQGTIMATRLLSLTLSSKGFRKQASQPT